MGAIQWMADPASDDFDIIEVDVYHVSPMLYSSVLDFCRENNIVYTVDRSLVGNFEFYIPDENGRLLFKLRYG